MEINGLLVKTMFDKNTNREFYIEESYPLDWMYPHLEPHGLIMKINRQPLPALSRNQPWAKTAIIGQNMLQPMIGDWLKADTSVEEVAAFAEKVFARNDFTGFTGDPHFIQNAYSHRSFPSCEVPRPGFTPGARTTRLTRRKRTAWPARRILPSARLGRCARIRPKPCSGT